MSYILAIFSSRNETLYFANMFRANGYFAGIINTPKEAGQACGISVKFQERSLPMAENFLMSKPFRSFVGFFRVTQIGIKLKLERI